MIRAAILSLVLIMAGVGSASAGECGKLCTNDWWETATQREIAAEIATVDVNAQDEHGGTPLHWTAGYGTPANLTFLLKAGADVSTRSDRGWTPLHSAALFGNPAKVLALLDAGADGGAKNDKNETPFDLAKLNEKPKGTDAYWRLNDAQYD